MNIKVFLTEGIPETALKEYPKEKNMPGDLRKAYIEFETGGILDELPQDVWEPLKEGYGGYLREFGKLLMSAIYLDVSVESRGMDKLLGADSIETGLIEIHKQLKQAPRNP